MSGNYRLMAGLIGCALAQSWAFASPFHADTYFIPKPIHLNGRLVHLADPADKTIPLSPYFKPEATYVLQLNRLLTPKMHTDLSAIGVTLGDYLSNNTYFARLGGVAPASLIRLRFISGWSEFRTEWKTTPDLAQRQYLTNERRALAARGEEQLLITLFKGTPAQSLLESLRSIHGAKIHYREVVAGNEIISVNLPLTEIALIAARDDVQIVEPAPEIFPRNSTNRWIVQSNFEGVTPFYDRGLTGVSQIMGIMDLKVDVNHCSFFDFNPIGPSHRKILAYNTTLGSTPHGTEVACTAVGDAGADNDTRGVAYGAKMVFAPIPGSSESGMYTALSLHHNQGARIHSNSWGQSNRNYDGLVRAIDAFSYDNEDDLILVATINSGLLQNPENAKNCLAVSAAKDTPLQTDYCFGGLGPTADGRRKPDLMGPGCTVNTAQYNTSCSTLIDNGTSLATPAVAAGAIVTRQYFMDGLYPTGNANPSHAYIPTGALLKAMLINSAVDMTGIAGYPSNQEGWGRILLDNACYFEGDARRLYILADVRNMNGLETDDESVHTFRIDSSSEPLRVTLVWTDPPASASIGTGPAWINDLDLEVTSPSSSLYLGNVFSGGVSVTGGSKDDKNNVEQIYLPSPETGAWTARVRGAAVNVGMQGFSLVVTGGVYPDWPAPTLSAITPDAAVTSEFVTITNCQGTGFQLGALLKLQRAGRPDVVASNVNVVSDTQITCSFNLNNVVAGKWNVVVANFDGQFATLADGFTVTIECVKGDMDSDGLVNGLDIRRFVEILMGGLGSPEEHCAGDVGATRDGVIGDDDVEEFIECLMTAGCK